MAVGRKKVVVLACGFASLVAATPAVADEGGVSFWLPGLFGSFAAVPAEPGFSVPMVYNHTSANAGASKRFVIGGNLTAGVDATADLLFFDPTYTFRESVLGGQAALSLGWAIGHMHATADVSVTGALGDTVFKSRTDNVSGGSDLYPTGTLKWHDGANNWMLYAMGDIPVGAYQLGRLANPSINHAAIDGGAGYTYFDGKNELSIVGGFTYNWENNATHYKNGTDGHLDFAASHFVSEQTHIGIVGYYFNQATGDSGVGATLGDFKSRVTGLGPEIGYFFPVGKSKGYVNLKAYWEFAAVNRAEGWNLWLELALPLDTGL